MKPYRHGCGKVEMQATNHWGPTYSLCPKCSCLGWQGGYTDIWECLETEFETRMKYAEEHGRPMPTESDVLTQLQFNGGYNDQEEA